MAHRGLACTCVLVLAISACADPVEPTRSKPHASAQELEGSGGVASGRSPNDDQRFIEAAENVEGFGGFFFDANGEPTVYLKNPGNSSSVDGRLRAMFLSSTGSRNQVGTRPIRYLTAKYDFKQLDGFRSTAGRLLEQERTAVSIDVDEVYNRVAIEVGSVDAQARLIKAARAAGIPDDGVVVSVVAPSQSIYALNDSLNSEFDPIPGGIQIFDTIYCTLGFTLNWNGRSGFATASHCSERFADTIPTIPMSQPFGGVHVVGKEVADPRPWQNTNDCALARFSGLADVCRYSDVAIYQAYDTLANSRYAVGYIARVTGYYNSNVINQTNPHFEIIGKRNPIYVGENMERMGVITYWTPTQITNSCITYYLTMPDGQKAKLWCQYKSSGSAIQGDSGGPIFLRVYCGLMVYRPDGTECVLLAGIAHTAADNFTRIVFSPMSGIDTDFGTTLVLPANQP
jgi:hypothetical protein